MPNTLYDEDFYRWSQETAQAIREGRFADVDFDHVAEEIRTLGTSEEREVLRRLALIMAHMLKIRHQPSKHTRSWDQTITIQRIDLRALLNRNPSLATDRALNDLMHETYRRARIGAARETHLDSDTFPKECPFTIDEVLPPEESD